MRIITIVFAGVFLSAIATPVGLALGIGGFDTFEGFSYSFGVAGLSVVLGNIWYNSIKEEK